MIKCVAFDIDGTLYNYDECIRYAESVLFKYLCNKFGKSNYKNKYLKSKVLVKKRLYDTASSHNRLLYMQKLCELLKINPVINSLKLYRIYWDTFFSKMILYPYVMRLFKLLNKKKIKIGILTDLTALIQHKKMLKMKISKYIDFIITSEEVGTEKPNINNFKILIQKSNCNPNEIIYIGDDYKRDYIGAKKCKLNSILYKKNIDIEKEVIKLL